ncbi:glycosyltransferase 87 family protein [Streptomyces sp. ICBB 8177]|uniref:glycosyltransferase 87 family protein n=1 Tax=Streptomyces sp. ICBB 8177 TaxID=563922 RepID=UPI001F54480A|nr:glycosyltransferase 87 family protein [Streptomyces sp. ICBB 8177]
MTAPPHTADTADRSRGQDRPRSRSHGRVRVRTALTVTLLAALTAATLATVATGGTLGDPGRLLPWYGVCWALFAGAAWAVREVPRRVAVPLVAVGAVALSLAALAAPPRTSDDMYRYAWDGRVQAAGISPYTYAPDAPRLAGLREQWLFPTGTACRGWDLHAAPGGVCTLINRPAVHTIYPPVAEAWYLVVHLASPPGSRWKPFQVAGAVLVVAVAWALVWALRRRGADPRRAALWAWCPAVPFAAVNDAHVDTLGVLLLVVAFGVGAGGRRGVPLGGAIAVKLLPGLALPGALSGVLAPGRPRRWRELTCTTVAAVGAVALAYLPYVAASGTGVIGYLPGYLQEEGYESGDVGRFALLRLVLPDAWAGPVAIAVVVGVSSYVLRRGDPARPWRGALLVVGTAFLVTSPAYYWYALMVVGLVALDGRWEWLAVPAAGTVLYIGNALRWHGLAPQAWPFGVAAAVVVAGAVLRGRAATRHASANAPASSVS